MPRTSVGGTIHRGRKYRQRQEVQVQKLFIHLSRGIVVASVSLLPVLFATAVNSQTKNAHAQAVPTRRPTLTPLAGTSAAATTATRRTMTPPKPVARKVTPRPAPVGAKPKHDTPPPPLVGDPFDRTILGTAYGIDHTNSFSVVYTGHRQSAIEPCGCAHNPLGGIDREARIDARLAETSIPVVRVDAGGFLKVNPNKPAIMRARHLFAAWQELKIDAVNVGAVDLGAGLQFLRDMQTSYSLPFISANLVSSADGELLFPPYLVKTVTLQSGEQYRLGIIGVTGALKGLQPDPMPELEASAALQWKTALAAVAGDAHCREWVALPPPAAEEPERGMGAAAPAQGATPEYRVLDTTGSLKKYMPELLAKCDGILVLDYEKLTVCSKTMTLVGAGTGAFAVVAGEYETMMPLPSDVHDMKLIGTSFEGRHVGNLTVTVKDGKPVRRDYAFIPIAQNITPLPAYTKFIEAFKTEAVRTGPAIASAGAVQTTSFIGTQACAECHKKEFDMWQETRHAKAMDSLAKEGAQTKTECLKCHVTGYGIDNGFKDIATTPEFANVQCEVCHGPAYQHVVESRRTAIFKKMGRGAPGAHGQGAAEHGV